VESVFTFPWKPCSPSRGIRTGDPDRATRVARKLAAGRVLINTLSHDPFAPFGGFKQSGIGREGGIFGLQEYLEPKAIIG
jgi:aldehyde dehydrogenase (NAD+)